MEMWESKFSLFPAFCQANFAFIVVPRKKISEKSLKTIFMSFWTTFFGNFAWNIFFFSKKSKENFEFSGIFFSKRCWKLFFRRFEQLSNFFFEKKFVKGRPKGKIRNFVRKIFFSQNLLKIAKKSLWVHFGKQKFIRPKPAGSPAPALTGGLKEDQKKSTEMCLKCQKYEFAGSENFYFLQNDRAQSGTLIYSAYILKKN